MKKAKFVTTTELDFDIAQVRKAKRRLNQSLRELVGYEKLLMKRKKRLAEERKEESRSRRERKRQAPDFKEQPCGEL